MLAFFMRLPPLRGSSSHCRVKGQRGAQLPLGVKGEPWFPLKLKGTNQKYIKYLLLCLLLLQPALKNPIQLLP